MKILMVSAEVDPFAKRGGLGDVAGSLPKALRELGHDVRVIMPAYEVIERGYSDVQPTDLRTSVPVRGEQVQIGLFSGHLPNTDVPVYFIAQQHLFNRPNVYGYQDDVYRFAFFSRAIFPVLGKLAWVPDILHAHDWHAAGAVFWLKTAGQHDEWFRNIKTVFTIHNLAHQGRASWDVANYMGIYTHALHEEPYGSINLIARGIYHSDAVTTVSPTYAREITTEAGGAGLHNLLNHRRSALYGIVNGLDTEVWDPAADDRITTHFDSVKLDERIQSRRALQDAVGLPRVDNVPILAMISRLDWQKGVNLLGEVAHRLMNNHAGEAQLVVLGSGHPEYEAMLHRIARYHSHKMAAITEYNAALAPLIYAGSDMFLMPSLFEPCGLSQLISMRYGCVPIARATGGLVDTIQDGETGFLFDDYSVEAFWQAVSRAIYVFNMDKARWRQMQLKGMAQDFSWRSSAEKYVDLYQSLLQHK